jgi:hypothetical protein
MGWLSNLFGVGRTKEGLIRALAKKRVASDPSAEVFGVTPAAIEALPLEMLMGLPEATIVMIVEAWSQGKAQSIPEDQVFELIEAHRSMAAEGEMPPSPTLESYITYRVSLEHSDGIPISEAHVRHCIREAREFFG